MSTLLLKSSVIFEDANIVDCIRQTCIGLSNSPNEEEIKFFLKESLQYLKNDLPFDVVNELFSAILLCLKRNRKYISSFLSHFLKRVKKNSNYLIVSSFIFSDLISFYPQLSFPEYEAFVEESLSLIIEQIKNENEKDIFLFGHSISSLFKNELIINLLLSSKITEERFLSFFPYFITHNLIDKNPKFDMLLEKMSNEITINILPQTKISDLEIFNFLNSEGQCKITSFSKEAITLIGVAVIFIKGPKKKKIKGLKKDTILQLLALIIVILQKYKMHEKVKFSSNALLELVAEGSRNLDNNEKIVLNKSIDIIVSNYFYINGTLSFPLHTILAVFVILLQLIEKDRYHGNILTVLFSIFDLSDKIVYYNIREQIKTFLRAYENLIISLILRHIYEINKDYKFKTKKLDMKFLDVDLFLSKLDYSQNGYQIIYFLEHSCTNISEESVERASTNISQILALKLKDNLYDEVLIVAKFMKKNELISMLNQFNLPDEIKSQLNRPLNYYENSIDKILKDILINPEPEENDDIFELLFNQLVLRDRDLLDAYLTLYLINFDDINSCPLNKFLTIYKDVYNKYQQNMIKVAKNIFDYYFNENRLVFKMNFSININIQAKEARTVILILYEEIKKNNACYQAFYCLMNLASSFPTLFDSESNTIFQLVYPSFRFLDFIFEKMEDEIHLPYIKTGYSALMFLASTLQSPYVVEEYLKWLFSNIAQLSDIQVYFSFLILNMLNESHLILNISQNWVIKYNFLQSIAVLLERKVKEGYFASCYKESIYNYLIDTYRCYLNYDIFIKAHVDEMMKFPHPIVCEFYRIHISSIFINRNRLMIGVNSPQLNNFIKNVNKQRKFWITYKSYDDNYRRINNDQMRDFTAGFGLQTPLSPSQLPELKKPITYSMAQYLTSQKYWVYLDIIKNRSIPHTNEMHTYLISVIKHLNHLKEVNDSNGKKEIDSNSFSSTDCFLSQYHQDSLIKSLINELFLPSLNDKSVYTLCYLFYIYASNKVSLNLLLTYISQCFTSINEKCIGYAPPSLLKVMYNLIEILTKMSTIDGFHDIFFEICGNNLINIILTPEFRCDPILLWNVSKFFDNFAHLPIRVTQIIGFMLIFDDEKVVSAGISLCSKFSYQELADINSLILNIFDNELKNEKRQSIIMILIKYSPSILEKRKPQMYSVLKGLLKKFLAQNNEKVIDLIGIIMTKLAPERDDFDDFVASENELTGVPLYIKEKNHTFWSLFEKYMNPIISLINNDPMYLNKFRFLSDYPEFVSFKVRSLLVRKTMKAMIDKSSETVLSINTKEILESSYNGMITEKREDLLKKIYIIFDENKKTVDMGGPTREWMSKLAKEIFNPKYGLFDCSKKMTYQPSYLSNIHSDHLERFRFAGIFVARALIEGQCIDAHLTSSFIKQILHRKLTLNDLEDIDQQLFNSLTWMLENDVDGLDMYFEIDSENLGVHETIPLKKNGSEIKVTNENKAEFVELNFQYVLRTKIKNQIDAFCRGFEFLIPHEKINCFTPKEFDLLICGVTDFDIDDFIENIAYEYPYSPDHPMIKALYKIIRSWDNEKLTKLFSFMTGSQRIPANGFKEFVEITGFPLKIAAGGENCLPRAHTCFNTIDLPTYSSEEEMRNKLLLAIQECDSFALL